MKIIKTISLITITYMLVISLTSCSLLSKVTVTVLPSTSSNSNTSNSEIIISSNISSSSIISSSSLPSSSGVVSSSKTLEATGSNVYKNTQSGFNFSLPESWKGYKIVTDKWEGLTQGDSQGEKTVATGPIIYIRHPQWTSQNPRQDIPIMIFTLTQWNSLQQRKFHIGAAPIEPSELGRNSRYVFALPARYNYAFPPGYEEVDKILNSNSLQPTENFSTDK